MANSHVLAADYRVDDIDRWWAVVRANRAELAALGAQHLVVYEALDDPNHVFSTVGIHSREPVDRMLRSGVVLEWFTSAGVEDIPPLFVGNVLEKLDLVEDSSQEPPGVVVAAVAPVEDVPALLAQVHVDASRFRSAGVRKVWLYRALDDATEVMILQEIDSEDHAARWMRHPEALGSWFAGVGVGVYPPAFVGRLAEVVTPG